MKNKTKHNWEEVEPYFETMTNRQIQDKFGIDFRIVSNYRHKHGKKQVYTCDKVKELVGKYPDHIVAKMTGKKQNTITRYRLRHDIPSANERDMKERDFQNEVAGVLNGETEVQVNNYRIDVLTDDSIIECKQNISRGNFYQAIGQLFIYSTYIYRDNLIIAYDDKNDNVSDQMITDAAKIGITVKQYKSLP